jgi:hypothetical protein
MSDPIVIVSAARTPMGSFQGDFASLAAHDLGGAAIKAAVERAGISAALVTELLFGNCLMAGQGQALFNAGADVEGFGSFSMFVESALSPLSSQISSQPYGGVGQDSPHDAHRDVGALPHSNDNSQLSLMIPPPLPSSNDWSPTVGSLGGGITSGDFKPMFSDSDRGSRMSSPSVPHPRMRHKQKAVETMMDIHSLDGPVSVGDGDGGSEQGGRGQGGIGSAGAASWHQTRVKACLSQWRYFNAYLGILHLCGDICRHCCPRVFLVSVDCARLHRAVCELSRPE